MEAALRHSLEQIAGTLDKELTDGDPDTCTEDLTRTMLQSEAFVTLRAELARDARAAAAACCADDATDLAEARARLLRAVPPHGSIGQALGTLIATPAEPPRGLTEWWEGGEDGVLDLDALDADSQASLPPYEQLAVLARQLHSAEPSQRRAAFDALEQYREHGLMGCPDWPAVCRALQRSLGDPVLALAERALQWHEELFLIATAGGEDAEVTQCADIFHNLTQHLLECYRPGHNESSPGSLAPEAVAASWHRAALGLVGAGWSLIHEPSIYDCVGATAQLMAIPQAMLAVAAIDPCALWFRRWVLAMHRRRRTLSCMAASAPELGELLLATLERGGIGSAGTVAPTDAAEPESEAAMLVLQHTVGVVNALMMFPEEAGAVLGPFLAVSTACRGHTAAPAAAAAVRDGSVGVHVMKLVCGVMTNIPTPHLSSHVCSKRLWETCAETLKVIVQRHPAAALRLMQLQEGKASELQREVGDDATAESVVVACGIEAPLTQVYTDAGETDSLSWLLQKGQPEPEPELSSTGTQFGDSSAAPTANCNIALRSIVHALEFTAAIVESSVCTDAMIQADRVDVRRRTRHQPGHAEAGTMKTSDAATDAAARDSMSEELCVTRGRIFTAVMRFTRWLVSGCSDNVQETATLSAKEHRVAATSAFSTARARARLVMTESGEGLTAASLLHPAVRIWRTVGNFTSSDGIARISAIIGQPCLDVPSFLLQILQRSIGIATEKCVSGGMPRALPRELLKMITTCLAEWSTTAAGWEAVAAAGTATQSASDRDGVEARESEVEDRDDRGDTGEAPASLSLLLPRLLVVSRGGRSHASRAYSERQISALLEPALTKRAMSTLLSTLHGTSALLDAGLFSSLLLELKATILDPAPAMVLALAEPPPPSLLPRTWCKHGKVRRSGGLYASNACAPITHDDVAGNQMALVHEVALVLASPMLLHDLLQPMDSRTYAPAGAANADGSVREASAVLRQIVMSALRARLCQQQEVEETASDQWLPLSDDGVHVVLRVLFHVATANPAAAALLDESFGLSTSLAAAVRATCLCSSASETGATSFSVAVDALSLERWRLWSALGAAGNFGGISQPPLPPPDIDMVNTAADELRRALLELEPETEVESNMRTAVVATNAAPQTELAECELLELAELAHSCGLVQQGSNAGTEDLPDPRQGSDKDQLTSQLRMWWMMSSADSLLSACVRPPTARVLLSLIVAAQHQQEAAALRSDGVAAGAPGEEPAGAMRRQRLSWLKQHLTTSIETVMGALPPHEVATANDFVASLVEALGRHDGLTTPLMGSEGCSRLSESVLGRVSVAVEALLEAELPALASVLIHGAHGHTYGTVSLLVHHWCAAYFCTGVIPAWCDAPPSLRPSDPVVLTPPITHARARAARARARTHAQAYHGCLLGYRLIAGRDCRMHCSARFSTGAASWSYCVLHCCAR